MLLDKLGKFALTVGGTFFVKCLTVPHVGKHPCASYMLRLPRAVAHHCTQLARGMCSTVTVPQGTSGSIYPRDHLCRHRCGKSFPPTCTAGARSTPGAGGARRTGRDAPPMENLPERHLLTSDPVHHPLVDVVDHHNRGFKFVTDSTCTIAMKATNELAQALGCTTIIPCICSSLCLKECIANSMTARKL